MAENTRIEWTDATVNFWWGCTKVGPGCDHCYAETHDRRFGPSHWGRGVARRKIKGAVALMHRLDNGYAEWAADYEVAAGNARAFGLPAPTFGPRQRVFVSSMADLFDLEVPLDWFREGWGTIEACDRIEIQIVTKRIGAVEKRLAAIGRDRWPGHAGLIITVTDQAEADRDVPRLLALKARLGIPWVGLSCEPLLGPVDLTRVQWGGDLIYGSTDALRGIDTCLEFPGEPLPARGKIDWIIAGGESGPGARPMHPDWARSLRDQCKAAGVPFFFKQFGEWMPARPGDECEAGVWMHRNGDTFRPVEGERFTPAPFAEHIVRVGKKAAGRLLDGVTHDGTPAAGRPS